MQNYEEDFPLLNKLHYLDNAATSLKPVQVVSAMDDYYLNYAANIHRGVYRISEQATDRYERVREKVAEMFCGNPNGVIFTNNTTESINQLALALSRTVLKKGDTILLTEMEHHSNIVPWLMLKQWNGIRVEYVKLNGKGLDYDDFRDKVANVKPKVVSFVHASNVLGTINNAGEIVKMCKDEGITTLMDCAQSAPHERVDMGRLGVDYIAFSSHKMLGPTGVGVLMGNEENIKALPPFFGGGSMIKRVEKQSFEPAEIPQRFEAGTPNIGGVIGFGAALNYLEAVGFERIMKVERELLEYALSCAQDRDYITVYSNKNVKDAVGIFAFNIKGAHPHDVSAILDENNVCIRAGHHCAQPLHESLGVPFTARASFYFYNTKEDVDALFNGLDRVNEVFSG